MKAIQNLLNRTSIGVSIETDAVRLAVARHGRVIRCDSIAYPPGVSPGSEAFPAFLRRCLSGFSSRWRQAAVWATGSLPSVQIRYLSLPPRKGGSMTDMVYWSFRKDLPFEADKTVFDYGVEAGGTGGEGLRVTAYTTERGDIERFMAPFRAAGADLAGVVIPAFAMRAVMQASPGDDGGTRIGLFTGDDASTLILMKAGRVQLSRVFKTGMQTLLAGVHEHEPGLSDAEAYRRVKALADAGGATAAGGGLPVREAFERLVQQIERSMAAYLNDYPGETFVGLHVMGAVAGLAPLTGLLRERLGLPVQALDIPANEPAQAGLAAGVALSREADTPNLLAPCHRREQAERGSWWSLLVALLLGLGLALLHLAHGVIEHGNRDLENRLTHERSRLEAYPLRLDEPMLRALTAQGLAEGQAVKQSVRRWLPLALLQELAALTPETVSLTGLEAAFPSGEAPVAVRGRARQAQGTGPVLTLRGVVRGSREAQRSLLAAYALELEQSPLFERADTVRTVDGVQGVEPVLIFHLELVTRAPGRTAPGGATEQEARP